MESRVIFHDRFVSPEEMAEFIGAADIYITPYRHEAQVVSGTLAYALGAGKAIISTPYWHAIELLDEGRGALVPFQDPDAIAQKTIELLTTPALRHAMRKRAYLFGRDMVWKKAAQGYMESFSRVRSDRMENPRVQFSARATEKSLNLLPQLKLDHVNALTDDTGMLQHAIFTIPNRAEGYTTDDNARALIFTVLMNQLATRKRPCPRQPKAPIPIGRSATWHFSNTLSMPRTRGSETFSATTADGWKSRDRKILTAAPCGRSEPFWAGRQIPDCGAPPGVLFEYSLPAVVEFHSPRACAYAVLGIEEYLHSYPGDRDAQRVRFALAQRLLAMYESIHRPDWKWFENVMAYGNARLPQAMLLVGSACGNERMLSAGLDSLELADGNAALPGQRTLCAHRLARLLPPGWRTGPLRSTAGGSRRRSVGLFTGLPRNRRRSLAQVQPGRRSTGFWATTISSFLSMIPHPAVAGTVCIPNAPIKTRERNPRCRS